MLDEYSCWKHSSWDVNFKHISYMAILNIETSECNDQTNSTQVEGYEDGKVNKR